VRVSTRARARLVNSISAESPARAYNTPYICIYRLTFIFVTGRRQTAAVNQNASFRAGQRAAPHNFPGAEPTSFFVDTDEFPERVTPPRVAAAATNVNGLSRRVRARPSRIFLYTANGSNHRAILDRVHRSNRVPNPRTDHGNRNTNQRITDGEISSGVNYHAFERIRHVVRNVPSVRRRIGRFNLKTFRIVSSRLPTTVIFNIY